MTGKIPFLSLIEAERNLETLRDRYYEAAAAYGQRLGDAGTRDGRAADLASAGG